MNTHFHTTVSISKRMLSAEVNTWLLADMMVFARALTTKTSRQVKRSDMGPYVFSATKTFSKDSWGSFCGEQQAGWESADKKNKKRASLKRRGPSAEQEEVYNFIKSKTSKRRRSSVFQGVCAS